MKRTIVLTGGGSGGHITPILAVATALKKMQPNVQLVYIGQRGDHLSDLPAQHPAIDKVYTIPAGKLRRYHGEGWRQLFDAKTQLQNLRDAGRTLAGLWQSFWLLGRLKPRIIFTRGGFVSVPVALAGALRGVPYITHDSDSTPSLANRLIAPWARTHAVALPAEFYPYPKAKTAVVGVPIDEHFQPLTPALRRQYREALGMPQDALVVLVTGGGNGAVLLNTLTLEHVAPLLATMPTLHIVHIAGRSFADEVASAYGKLPPDEQKRAYVHGFVTDLYRYSGAADLVIARGGATALAEFAMQGLACLIIPAKQLVWQGHHARTLAAQHAIVYLAEDKARQNSALTAVVRGLLEDPARREKLQHNLHRFAVSDTAQRLAMLLLEQSA